ncbi:acyl-CoA dehydrogenase [Streptomyces hirsutus]|uniref:acyl-CoA dehydrogenase n=1 Tax=Streptomyces hirsutus TaxID=35620 RepID=UPI000B25A804|nr:acyl-CoA dehydrogenase [Streptomyces hirsutus]
MPERHEGFGPLPLELSVAFVETGRHAVPGPLVETVAAAALLDRLGDADAACAHLPGIASGKTVVSLCLTALGPYALDADAADTVLVVDGDTLRVGARPGPVQPSADPGRRLSRPVGGTVLAEGPAVLSAAAYAADEDPAALATAAQSLGLGRALLARTVEYVKQRTQFGVAIGSFQAVKHRLADAYVLVESARSAALGAAFAADEDPAALERAAAVAKSVCSEAFSAVAGETIQLHGGIGITWEHDAHRYFKRAHGAGELFGAPAAHRARLAAGLGLTSH